MIRREFSTVFDAFAMAVITLIAMAYGVYEFLNWLLGAAG